MYKWLSLKSVLKYEDEIIKEKVSEIARGKNGFLTEYKRYKTANAMSNAKIPGKLILWGKKRDLFISRTLPAYVKNPTHRRWISLIAWAYFTPKLH
jgi:hypothetical protein